jgi:hypothetical protein
LMIYRHFQNGVCNQSACKKSISDCDYLDDQHHVIKQKISQ